MAEPPLTLPQPPGVPIAAAPLHLMASSNAGAQLVAPTSAPGHVAQNPIIGDSGEVESRAWASMAEVLPDAKISMEEDCAAALPSQPSNVNDEDSVCLAHTYLANPHEEYEHVGVDEDQYSIGSAGSDSDDEVREKNIQNIEYVEDSSDDEEWVMEDARPDAIPEIAYDKENPPIHVGAMYPNIEEFRLAIATYTIKKSLNLGLKKVNLLDLVLIVVGLKRQAAHGGFMLEDWMITKLWRSKFIQRSTHVLAQRKKRNR
ncbi:hypothetical protein D1007_00853 [Hordeum vulgare]|nr:hypothetical protein D1007_00853 [Hordeum vulgare]